jgi:hypothetical protein
MVATSYLVPGALHPYIWVSRFCNVPGSIRPPIQAMSRSFRASSELTSVVQLIIKG